MILRKHGKYFPVQLHSFLLERRDEGAVFHPRLTRAGVHPRVPECAVLAFLFLASAKTPAPRVEERLLCGALFGFTAPPETLRGFQETLAFLVGGFPSFDPGHAVFV